MLAEQRSNGAPGGPDGRFGIGGSAPLHLLFPATELSVRRALVSAGAALRGMGLEADTIGFAEILLAEVLNNVVEHAYAGERRGSIELEIIPGTAHLSFRMQDWGAPMPGLKLPEKKSHDLTGPLEDLPEGGFGWFMIHSLTRNLLYTRDGERNCLRFVMDHTPEAALD